MVNRPAALRRRLLSRTALSGLPLAMGLALLPGTALALPQDGVVAAGAAAISQTSATNMQINQSSMAAIIDWQSFDIGAGEMVEVFQPSAMATLLNRVVGGGGASNILGQLSANGQLTLINPSGITIGHSARIDVAGLIATSANIGNASFMAGNHAYSTPGMTGAQISNAGAITATDGGLVALVGPSVANSGAINARLGRVVLGGAETFTLDLYGDDLIHIGVDDAVMTAITADALVTNSGAITVDGGVIQITARGGAAAIENVINMSGVVRARSVGMENGEVVFYGHDQGIVQVSGSVDASGKGAGQSGGTIRVLGDKVALLGNASLDTSGDAGGGEILVGGEFQGGGDTPTASRTFVGRNASINTSAISTGNAGTAIVWADGDTRYYGSILAKGGALSGNGGTVEVSGKQNLGFDGAVDTSAPNGTGGSLLLDPDFITIVDFFIESSGNNADVADGVVQFADAPLDFFVSEEALEALTGSLVLQANKQITIEDLADNLLNLNNLSLASAFQIGNPTDTDGGTGFTMNAGDTLQLDVGFSITANGGSISLGSLTSTAAAGVGLTGLTIDFNGVSSVVQMLAQAAGGINIYANLTATGTGITFDADTNDTGPGLFNVANLATVSTPSGGIGITASDINLNATGALSALGTGVAITHSTGGLIALGNSDCGCIALSDSELDRITTVTGASFTTIGNIDINTVSNVSIGGGMLLVADQISFLGAASTLTGVEARAENGLSLNVNLTTTTLGMILDGDFSDNSGGGMSIANGLVLTSADGIVLRADKNSPVGNISAVGAVILQADNGVQFDDNFTSGGSVTINADTGANGGDASGFGITNNSTLDSGGFNIDITTNGILLTGIFNNPILGPTTGNGFIDAGGALVTFNAAFPGLPMELGDGSGIFNFATSELQRVTAGTTTFDGKGGSIFVSGVSGVDAMGPVNLFGGAQVTFQGGASTFFGITAAPLNGVFVNANLSTTSGSVFLDGDGADGGGPSASLTFGNGVTLDSATYIQLLADATGPGNIVALGALNLKSGSYTAFYDEMQISGLLTINAGDGIDFNQGLTGNGSLDATAGADIFFSGLVSIVGATVNADEGVFIQDNFTATGGNIFINADLDGDGYGDFNAPDGVLLSAPAGNISITTANDEDGSDIIAAGALSFTLTIGDLLIDGFEGLTASSVDIFTLNGSIEFDGIVDASALGPVSLNSASNITFDGGPATFAQLSATAGAGIRLFSSVTVNAGDVLFNADSDASGSGTFRVADGATLTVAGGGIDLFAADVNLGSTGAINAATFFHFTQTAGATINLGAGAGAGTGGDADGSGFLVNTDFDDYAFTVTDAGNYVFSVIETIVDDDSDFDSVVLVYFDDGSVDLDNFIGYDDDDGGGPSGLESLLALDLAAGNYVVRVGTHGLTEDENNGHHDGTDYTLLINGEPFGGGGGGSGFSASELQRITAGGGATSFTTTGDIIVDGVTGADGLGDVTLTGHHIFFQGGASEFAGAVEMFADDLVEISGGFASQSLFAEVTGDDGLIDIQVNLGETAPLDFVMLTADTVSLHDVTTNGPQTYGNGVVIFNSTYNTGGGAFVIAGSVVANSPSTINTGGGAISISGGVTGAGASALVFNSGGGPVLVAGVDPTGPSDFVEEAAVDSSNSIDALVGDDAGVSEDDADEDEDILEDDDEEGEEAESDDPYLEVVEEEDLGESGDANDDEGSSPGCACGA